MLQQACNPAVGGPAKCQLVLEVDALGGEIGKTADRTSMPAGRAGESASHGLTENLQSPGFETDWLKTGTPACVISRTVDYSLLEPQHGDEEVFALNLICRFITENIKSHVSTLWMIVISKAGQLMGRFGYDPSGLPRLLTGWNYWINDRLLPVLQFARDKRKAWEGTGFSAFVVEECTGGGLVRDNNGKGALSSFN
ncbi:hypothetical protein L1987_89944 [Smallanthus sonchifolius]|nr:hypothetical protein L1987_89944 [Smallanthus sonchifolius]